MRSLLAVRGIEKTSPGFRRKLIAIADRNGLNADYIAAVISFETGGMFSASVRNPASGAIGLIQFLSSTAKTLGTSTAALAAMSPEEQLDWVERYYRIVAPKGLDTLENHYLVVLTGHKSSSPDAVLFQAPSKAYEQNKGFDTDNDGVITAREATTPVRNIVKAAEGRAPILVDMNASEGTPVVLAGSVFLLAMGILSWSHFGKGLRHSR